MVDGFGRCQAFIGVHHQGLVNEVFGQRCHILPMLQHKQHAIGYYGDLHAGPDLWAELRMGVCGALPLHLEVLGHM